ncbi:MAG TPA: DUF4835 family protein [Bacteroidales bacterium]|nr:DUF4835 family protein [Bacteroidales bacterium]
MNRKVLLSLLLIVLFYLPGQAQELRCNVQIISNQIQGTNKQIYRTLQQDIYEFMNSRIWTERNFENTERIECKILINLNQHTGDQFNGSITVSSRRPVFNSSYNTTMFQFKDNDFQFRYLENEPLEFDINQYKSNLTSILAYYAYIIIGIDFDSFSPGGGTPYFQRARQIVSNAQNARGKGWKAYESRRNRYWLVENILNNEYRPVRQFIYRYHRLGLDQMHDSQAQARASIFEGLELLREVHREQPDPYMFFMNLMLEAKSNEFINVFSESPQSQASRAYEILAEIDPSQSEKYKKITR